MESDCEELVGANHRMQLYRNIDKQYMMHEDNF